MTGEVFAGGDHTSSFQAAEEGDTHLGHLVWVGAEATDTDDGILRIYIYVQYGGQVDTGTKRADLLANILAGLEGQFGTVGCAQGLR